MDLKNIIIREATSADISELTELMNDLGYDTTQEEMRGRFSSIQKHRDYKTLVATIEKKVIGMVGLTRNIFFERNGIYVRVVALVTKNKFRRKGVGNYLMHAAEDWAKNIGANTVKLNCGNRDERKIAQKFYRQLGYSDKSIGFLKEI